MYYNSGTLQKCLYMPVVILFVNFQILIILIELYFVDKPLTSYAFFTGIRSLVQSRKRGSTRQRLRQCVAFIRKSFTSSAWHCWLSFQTGSSAFPGICIRFLLTSPFSHFSVLYCLPSFRCHPCPLLRTSQPSFPLFLYSGATSEDIN